MIYLAMFSKMNGFYLKNLPPISTNPLSVRLVPFNPALNAGDDVGTSKTRTPRSIPKDLACLLSKYDIPSTGLTTCPSRIRISVNRAVNRFSF